ncbi:MPPV-073 hypothetical protein [Magpiepox virus 2]|nr:MPPV-073 hypothetical protein [Magpiepox virus 2]
MIKFPPLKKKINSFYLISSNMYLVINVLTSCILFMILSNAYYIDISGSGDRDNSKHKNMFSVIDL